MPSRARKILPAMMLGIALIDQAEADQKFTFGQHVVEAIDANHSVMLLISGKIGPYGEGSFSVQCFLEYKDGLAMRFATPSFSEKFKSPATVTVWSDQADPVDIGVTPFPDGVTAAAITQNKSDGAAKSATALLGILSGAKGFIAFSAGGSTSTINTTNLSAALSRFKALCGNNLPT